MLDPPAGFGAFVPGELSPEDELGGCALTPPEPDGLDDLGGFGFFEGVLVVCDGVLGVLVVVVGVLVVVVGVLVDAAVGALSEVVELLELLEWVCEPPQAVIAMCSD